MFFVTDRGVPMRKCSFSVTNGGSQLTFRTQLEKVQIFVTNGGSQLTFKTQFETVLIFCH